MPLYFMYDVGGKKIQDDMDGGCEERYRRKARNFIKGGSEQEFLAMKIYKAWPK